MPGHDLTRGSVPRWLVVLSLPVFLSFVLQSAYALVNLFWVGYLGGPALAAVGIALNSFLVVLALAQAAGSGALALISQAYGRRDEAGVRAVFQQSFWLVLVLGGAFWAAGYALAGPFFDLFTADPDVRAEGVAFLRVYSITFLLQTFLIAMSACWRAIGGFLWPTAALGLNVMLNSALDPLLIFGWGPVPAMGIVGAAWATVIAQTLAALAYLWLILGDRRRTLLVVRRPFLVDWPVQGALLRIGVPSGLLFMLAALGLALTYRAVRPFGAEVAAGIGVGFRILQAVLYPAIAVGAAAASLAGQNTGARLAARVRGTLGWGGLMGVAVVGVQYGALLLAPHYWMSFFADEPAIHDAGASYISITGLAMVLAGFGIVMTFSSQAMGRALWPLLAVAARVAVYAAALALLGSAGLITPSAVFWSYVAAVSVEMAVVAYIALDLVRVTRGWEGEAASTAATAAASRA